jgi:DNA polymerase-3 subunit beta
MEIRISQELLSSLLSRAQSVIERKSTRAILENVLLESHEGHLRVSATDLRISLLQEAICSTIKSGSVAIPARKFHEVVRELPKGEVVVEVKENQWVTVSAGKVTFHLPASPADEYPTLPAIAKNFISFSCMSFRRMIEKTIFAASNDESRIYLTGVFLKEWRETDGSFLLRMVATDGHRMSLIDRAIERPIEMFSEGVIVPKKGLGELRNLLDTNEETFDLACSEGRLYARTGNTTLSVTLIDASFPNYEQVIPQEIRSWIQANRSDLANALRRVALLSDEETRTVVLEATEESLMLSSDNPRFGDAREEMAIQYEGSPIKIAFNATYFMDLLRAMEGDDVKMGITDGLAPCLVQGVEDSKYLSVIMPMRID